MAGYNCICSRCGIAIRLIEPNTMGPTVRCSRCESLYGVPPEPRGVAGTKSANPRRVTTQTTPHLRSTPQEQEIPLDADLAGLGIADDGWADIQRRQRRKTLAMVLAGIGAVGLIVGIVVANSGKSDRKAAKEDGDDRPIAEINGQNKEKKPGVRSVGDAFAALVDRVRRPAEVEEPDGAKNPLRHIVGELRKWSPPNELLEELGPEVELGDFSFRQPRSYPPLQVFRDDRKLGANAKITGWLRAAIGPDGTRPSIMAYVFDLPPVERNQSLEAAHRNTVERLRLAWSSQASWRQDSAEYGEINGIPFMRTRWTATGTGTRVFTLVGVQYTGKSAGTVISLETEDIPLGEASILTVRRKPQ